MSGLLFGQSNEPRRWQWQRFKRGIARKCSGAQQHLVWDPLPNTLCAGERYESQAVNFTIYCWLCSYPRAYASTQSSIWCVTHSPTHCARACDTRRKQSI
eukprot:58803-Chlamydomonas_euryale.AAC.6